MSSPLRLLRRAFAPVLALGAIACEAGDPLGGAVPVPGELTIVQLDLPIGTNLERGESALVVGPDGTRVLIDVGDEHHDDQIRDAIAALPGEPAVDWVILTHFHGDHIGAFTHLDLPIRRGVIHRGFVDLGDGMKASAFEAVCKSLRGDLAALDHPLCETAETRARCDGSARATAIACPGVGEVLPLGAGATLTIAAANGFVFDGAVARPPATRFGVDANNEENARSVVGVITHGDFRYHFGGDLTGSGKSDEPDIESRLLDESPLYRDRFSVVHAHHHARDTSSNARFVAATAPFDVTAGINAGYVGSPHADVESAWTDQGAAFFSSRQHPIVVQTSDGGAHFTLRAGTDERVR